MKDTMGFQAFLSNASFALLLSGIPTTSPWRLVRGAGETPAGAVGLSACALVSPTTPLDKGGDPQYGSFFLVISRNSAISIQGTGVGLFWNGVREVVLRAGNATQAIAVNRPVEAGPFLDKLASPGVDRVAALIRFAQGDPVKINFSLKGLPAARAAAAKCLSASAPAAALPRKNASFTLASFLQSPVAKKYGVMKGDGWALRDGAYNNTLNAVQEPTMTIEMATRNDQVVHLGFTVHGSKLPDADQIALMNDFLRYASSAMGAAATPSVRATDFNREYTAISAAPPRQFGRFVLRAGSVLEPVLSVDIKP